MSWCVQEPPALLEEMDNKMTSLMEETFDPSTHPSMQEFAQILSSRVEGGESGGDEDIQVEKVCSYWSQCPCLIHEWVC